MKATDVTQHSIDVSKSALAGESPILGTWKLQSLVFEATATGQRSSPFGDHPVGYLSYSADGRMYAIGVVEDLLNLAWSQVDNLLAVLVDFERETSLENRSPELLRFNKPEPETEEENEGAS